MAEKRKQEIIKKDMFSDENKQFLLRNSPFFKVKSESSFSRSSFPSLFMNNGFYRNTARSEAILTLRILANQSAKSLQNKTAKNHFLGYIYREIHIKSGRFEAEIMMRDALINKYLDNS